MGQQVAAFFDVDGTLLRGNIVRYYAFLKRRRLGGLPRLLWTASLILRAPILLIQDRISREWFARNFYRGYRSIPPGEMPAGLEDLFEDELRPNFYAQALDCVNHHLEQGHQVVLVSGSIRQIVERVARHVGATAILCVDLEEKDGRFTGRLAGDPLTGEFKATSMRRFARDNRIDLEASFAYADSMDDVPMLEQVRTAVVINPDRRLLEVARHRGWQTQVWKAHKSRQC